MGWEWDQCTLQMLGKGGPVGLRRKYLKSSVMFDYQIPAHKQKGKI